MQQKSKTVVQQPVVAATSTPRSPGFKIKTHVKAGLGWSGIFFGGTYYREV